MVGRAVMAVAAMAEEATAAVAEGLMEAGAVVATVAEVAGVVALGEAGAGLAAEDVELKMFVATHLYCSPYVSMHDAAGPLGSQCWSWVRDLRTKHE